MGHDQLRGIPIIRLHLEGEDRLSGRHFLLEVPDPDEVLDELDELRQIRVAVRIAEARMEVAVEVETLIRADAVACMHVYQVRCQRRQDLGLGARQHRQVREVRGDAEVVHLLLDLLGELDGEVRRTDEALLVGRVIELLD